MFACLILLERQIRFFLPSLELQGQNGRESVLKYKRFKVGS